MAIWQYDVYLKPRSELIAQFGNVHRRFTSDELGDVTFWTTCQPVEDFKERFTRWRAELPIDWSSTMRWWGTDQSNRIDVFEDDGRVSSIRFRIDLRVLEMRFIQLLVDVARDSDCVIMSAHTGEIIEPVRDHVLSHLVSSNGANEIWDWQRHPDGPMSTRTAARVFLSHSSADKEFVSKLAIALRTNNVPVWYDKWELKVGDSLNSKIAEGIDASDWLVVVLSEYSVKSDWVEKELNAALSIELERKGVFVLPVVVDDCKLPIFLRDKLYADFRTSYKAGLDALLDRVLKRPER